MALPTTITRDNQKRPPQQTKPLPTSISRDNHPVKRGRRLHPDRRSLHPDSRATGSCLLRSTASAFASNSSANTHTDFARSSLFSLAATHLKLAARSRKPVGSGALAGCAVLPQNCQRPAVLHCLLLRQGSFFRQLSITISVARYEEACRHKRKEVKPRCVLAQERA